jgi:hypothetical protein
MTKSIFTFLFILFALNASAQYYGWSRTIGGADADTCVALAIDDQANLYAVGSFSGYGDFRNDTIKDNLISNGKDDVFLQKRSKKGKYIWSKKIGGKGNDRPSSMIYYNGSLFITGTFEDTLDFGIQKIIPQGKKSIFLAKMDTAGNCLWVKTLGDTLYSRARSLAINKDGIYLSGEFSGKIEKTAYINSMFLQKRDLNGNVNWTKTFGTKRSVVSNSITLDSLGNLFNVGSLLGNNVDFDPSPIKDSILSSTTNGLSDIFIQKVNANGDLFWVKKIGGSAADEANTIISKGNEIYVSGYFSLTVDFDPSLIGISNLSSKGGKDIFIGKYDLSGKLLWIKQIGNTKEETAKQLEIDKYKNIYLVGTFNTSSGSSTDFLGKSLSTSGNNDAFLLKFDVTGKGILVKQYNGSGSDYGSAIKADTMYNVYIAGSYSGNLNIVGATKGYSSTGSSDVFIYKSLLLPTSDDILVGKDTSGVSIFENTLNFSIYPNPVSNELKLSFEPLSGSSSVSITSISGQILLQKEFSIGQTEENINTSDFKPGIYFVKLTSGISSYTHKIYKL